MDTVGVGLWHSVGSSIRASLKASPEISLRDNSGTTLRAYVQANWLACYHFFDDYLASNDLHALAHFNELVAGYRLGQEGAIIVRRPRVLARFIAGRLHSATGKCLEYRDGWGFYAWHGVQVPEQVILDPDDLTREEFLSEPNVEVRRVMQERMGSRFVRELSGVVIDAGSHGTLYEVRFPDDDPERVARYVQVQDASTPCRYFLRVPPTIQTAAEAIAWSFNLPVEAYNRFYVLRQARVLFAPPLLPAQAQ